MDSSKPTRRRMIERLLQTGRVTSQHGLLKQLRAEGVDVTQATLSRDLADLGVMKGPTGWQLPGSAAVNNSDISAAVQTYLLDVEVGGQMVVLRTRTTALLARSEANKATTSTKGWAAAMLANSAPVYPAAPTIAI